MLLWRADRFDHCGELPKRARCGQRARSSQAARERAVVSKLFEAAHACTLSAQASNAAQKLACSLKAAGFEADSKVEVSAGPANSAALGLEMIWITKVPRLSVWSGDACRMVRNALTAGQLQKPGSLQKVRPSFFGIDVTCSRRSSPFVELSQHQMLLLPGKTLDLCFPESLCANISPFVENGGRPGRSLEDTSATPV